jgi:hypothetical protein
MGFDCSDEASSDCLILKVVDARDLPGNIADSPNKRLGVLHALGLAGNGDLACHVKSTPPTGVERRRRRQCRPELSELIGDRRAAARRVTTHQPYEQGGQPG